MTEPMVDLKTLKGPLSLYTFLRSALYTVEGLSIPAIEFLVNRHKPRLLTDDRPLFLAARSAMERLFRQDIDNIIAGVYPIDVLKPGNPVRHMMRVPSLFKAGFQAAKRRAGNQAKEFTAEARTLLEDVPEYYQRNFHFQENGYLSESSARLYDHQVEVLFSGAADAMRRLILKPLKDRFPATDGEGLTFLEIGAGTGQATLFTRMAFPKAKIVVLDLSAPYLKAAQEKLRKYPRLSFVEADAARLPFRGEFFDAVYSVFLFHELPMDVRLDVLSESLRVLKPGGFLGLVDSLQLGDTPPLDAALSQFPRDYHEPFYTSYIKNPMERVFEEVGATNPESDLGFFSKAVWGLKRD